jgi:hypothetical protein
VNKKEFELIADVFKSHRKTYGNRTDTVTLELLADMIRDIEHNYKTFRRFAFYESLELTLEDVGKLEHYINN